MKHKFLRMLSLIVLLALLAQPAMAWSLLGDDRISASSFSDNGVIRVWLKSLGAPRSLTLKLDGVYTVEQNSGFRFDRGSTIVLSAGEDGVWLTSGGLKIDMGAGVTLTRHQAASGEENGLRIAEIRDENLYMGDLSVSLQEGGGLRAILSIHIEDYLLGVVGYEMSDSWPLEALKAQAVAARTYAMQRKGTSAKRAYDVTNDTSDQMFRGYNAAYSNVEAAVRETEGVAGFYKGDFATCYYTASNGGQTALPGEIWGNFSDCGYLSRREDPYDLENALSIVSSVTFTPGAQDVPALHAMLTEGLLAAAEEQGISADGLELCQILKIEPADPAEEGSRMYRKLRFTLSALAPAAEEEAPVPVDVAADAAVSPEASASPEVTAVPAPEESPAPAIGEKQLLDQEFIVDLDVFSDIKDGLGLGVNSSDCELVSVKEGVFEYTIEMRRYGHGVGLSQRGAQTMAGQYGKTWLEILEFYYPGMDLQEIWWDTPALTAIESLPQGFGAARPEPTPMPTPLPLPQLTGEEYYARVNLADASSSLNIRQNPSTNSPIQTQMMNGWRLIVCGEADADGWVQVKTAEVTGYCKLEYLKAEE